MFCCVFGLIFPISQILNFGDFLWRPGSFFDHFRTPVAPTASRVCPNIDFEALKKSQFFIICNPHPGLSSARKLDYLQDLDLSLCQNLDKYVISKIKLVPATLNVQKCEKNQKWDPDVTDLLGRLLGQACPSQLNYSKSRALRVTPEEFPAGSGTGGTP